MTRIPTLEASCYYLSFGCNNLDYRSPDLSWPLSPAVSLSAIYNCRSQSLGNVIGERTVHVVESDLKSPSK